jgi:hypothetical protein
VSATAEDEEQGHGDDEGNKAEPLPVHEGLLDSSTRMNATQWGKANLVKGWTKSKTR